MGDLPRREEMKDIHKRAHGKDILTLNEMFVNLKRMSGSEHTVKMAPCESFE